MNKKTEADFLDHAVALLVEYFGAKRVRAALTKLLKDEPLAAEGNRCRQNATAPRAVTPSITTTLAQLRTQDEAKYDLLARFYEDLKDRQVLRESEDIRHFAQLIGLKEIRGKDRKSLIPKLIRFLMEYPTDVLREHLSAAANVSAQQRSEGFSVLSDKLAGDV